MFSHSFRDIDIVVYSLLQLLMAVNLKFVSTVSTSRQNGLKRQLIELQGKAGKKRPKGGLYSLISPVLLEVWSCIQFVSPSLRKSFDRQVSEMKEIFP